MVPSGRTTLRLGELSSDGLRNGIFKRKAEFGEGAPLVNVRDTYGGTEIEVKSLGRVRVTKEEQERFSAIPGDVFFVRSSLVKEGIAEPCVLLEALEPMVFECHIIRVRPKPELVDPLYLAHEAASRSVRHQVAKVCKTQTMTTISQDALASLEFRVPPLAEQKRIADALRSVEIAVGRTQAVIDQIRVVKKGLVRELLTRGLPGLHSRFKRTEIGEIPESWEVVRAGDACTIVTKGTTPPRAEMTSGVGEVPFLKVYNIDPQGFVDFGYRPTFVAQSVHQGRLRRSRVRPGDVLMNIVGPPLGKVALVPEEMCEANINQAIAFFRCGSGLMPRFLAACLQTEQFFGWARQRAKRTSTQLNLTLGICRDFPLPMPPRSEQEEILDVLDVFERRIETERAKRTSLVTLFDHLREALLSGVVGFGDRGQINGA